MYAENQTLPTDMVKSRAWSAEFFGDPANLPISFVFNGMRIHGIPQHWNPETTRRRIDANLLERTFTGQDPASGLQVRLEALEYHDYPVVEWTAWFTNRGAQPSALISDIQALDEAFSGESAQIYHCNGDFYSEYGYTPEETPLEAGDTLAFTPAGGRPSDSAFPYYRVLFEGCGISLAIGWPGQWAVKFSGLEGGVHILAGQELTSLRLNPGETVRTPRITLMSWSGDSARAINLWRRWYLAHVLPRPDGQPLKPKLAVCGPEEGEEFTAATEENQLVNINKFTELGFDFDVWWIDAGWYPCYNENHERRWWITGTWIPDPERFPNGMKPVSDFAAQNGADLLVWFEPERIRPGTRLEEEHPQWLLRSAKDDNSLLNLGDPEVRRWLTDHVCRLIQENGIKIYRQDFNFPPLDHWRSNDAPDRQGMNENLHVQGYLQYWDDLLARNPGLWIDSCSSGGRRNDMETMRRSVPLHYTDYGYGNHPVKLAFHRTLYEWIPYFKECTLSWDLAGVERFDHDIDSFSFHCGLAPMLFATFDIRREDYDFQLARQMVKIWRRAAGTLLHGDYYPLTPFHKNAGAWVAWQFDQPREGKGFVQGIRLQECAEERFCARLQGLDDGAMYRLENMESGEVLEVSGAALAQEGFSLALAQRAGVIWFYEKE